MCYNSHKPTRCEQNKHFCAQETLKSGSSKPTKDHKCLYYHLIAVWRDFTCQTRNDGTISRNNRYFFSKMKFLVFSCTTKDKQAELK